MITKKVQEFFQMRQCNKKFGIECELEGNFAGIGRYTMWEAHNDGSLRNGVEFASKPVDDVRAAMVELSGALVNCQINNSYRCSTHIHMNMQQRTFNEVIALYIAWATIEPLFLSRFPERSGSIYCLSSYECGDQAIAFARFCKNFVNDFWDGYSWRQKYSSLNMQRLSDLGTAEFRIFPASTDPTEVERWSQWLTNLEQLAIRYADDYTALVRYMEKSPSMVAGEVFGGDVPWSRAETGLLMDLGARQGYEMARAYQSAVDAFSKKRPKKKDMEEQF